MDDVKPSRQIFYLTACISLLAHLVLLLAPWSPLHTAPPSRRLDVLLTPMASRQVAQTDAPATAVIADSAIPNSAIPGTMPQPAPAHPSPHAPPRAATGKRALTSAMPVPAVVDESRYSQAERQDIDNFLQSLGPTSNAGADRQAAPAQAISRNVDREPPRARGDNTISVERVPNSPPIDRASMQAYISAVTAQLYGNASRMAAPKNTGSQTAAVKMRINADGTLLGVTVIDAGDQQEQVDFTKRLLERSAPYPGFPSAMAASIKVLTISFCIRPEQDGDAGVNRSERGRVC